MRRAAKPPARRRPSVEERRRRVIVWVLAGVLVLSGALATLGYVLGV